MFVLLPMQGVRAVGTCCQVMQLDLLLPALMWVGICATIRHSARFPDALSCLWTGFMWPETLGYRRWDCMLQGSKAGICAAALGTGHTSLLYGRSTPKVLAVCDVWIRISICSYIAFLIVLAGQGDNGQYVAQHHESGAKLVETTLGFFLDSQGMPTTVMVVLALIRFVMNFCHLLAVMMVSFLAVDFFEVHLGVPQPGACMGLMACAFYWQGT